MSDRQVERLVKSSFERMKSRFDKAAKPYHINTRPYYSSGAVPFEVSLIETVGGIQRYVARAAAGTEVVLFSYGQGDSVRSVFLGDRDATSHDTNMATQNKTNAEDVAIEGFSIRSRGVRAIATITGAPAALNTQLQADLGYFAAKDLGIPCEDPGARIFAPETHSPVTLEDLMWRAIAPKMTFTTQWNKKAVDLLGTMNLCPEGGGNSFLKANGDPSSHNYFRLPEGLYWRSEGSGAAAPDTLFSVVCKLEQDVVVVCSSNEVPYAGTVSTLKALAAEFTLKAHARSFYYPSSNN